MFRNHLLCTYVSTRMNGNNNNNNNDDNISDDNSYNKNNDMTVILSFLEIIMSLHYKLIQQ